MKTTKIDHVFSSARWILIASLLQKFLSFILNQFIIQWTSPEIFGLIAIQLELLLSTLLFLSRDGIRLASLRVSADTADLRQRLINLSWLPSVFLFLVIISLFFVRMSGFLLFDTHIAMCYCIGALLESLGEPWTNMYQHEMQLGARVAAETLAVSVRSVISCTLVVYFGMGVMGFGIAQISYGATHFFVVLSFMQRHAVGMTALDFLPRPIVSSDANDESKNIIIIDRFFDRETLHLAYATTWSTVLKHVLTEADKILLSIFASAYDQGVFALISNYGSFVARTVFLPLEEATRLVFSRLFIDLRSSQTDDNISNRDSSNSDTTKKDAPSLRSAEELLFRILRLVGAVGAVFAIFGAPGADLAIQAVFARSWRGPDTTRTLSAYCFYLLVLGINGVSEAFVQAVAPESSFRVINLGMMCSTISYVLLAAALVGHLKLGTAGLVMAACGSMSVRIYFSFFFILGGFEEPEKWFTVSRQHSRPSSAEHLKKKSNWMFGSILTPLVVSVRCIGLNWILVSGSLATSWYCWGSARGYINETTIFDSQERMPFLSSLRFAGRHVMRMAAAASFWLTLVYYQVGEKELVKMCNLLRGKVNLE